QTLADVGALVRRGHGLQSLKGVEVFIESLGIDGGEVVNISPLGADKKGSVLNPFDRAADASLVLDGIIIWLRARERVGRIECRIVSADLKLAMVIIGPRLGENFDAAVTELVIFRREWILINANLANRRFWRKLASRKTVNVELAAVRSRGRPGQRLQVGEQFVGIVGQRVQLLTGDDDRSGIASGIHIDGWHRIGHLNTLLLNLDAHGDV